MTGFEHFKVKNAMLFSNFVSNAIGVAVIVYFTRQWGELVSPGGIRLLQRISLLFIPLSFCLPFGVTLVYEKPIRDYLDRRYQQQIPSDACVLAARQRLLNEPFFLIFIDMIVWLVAAGLYSWVFKAHGFAWGVIGEVFNSFFFTGLITVTIAFFVFEFVRQRRIIHHFFSAGGLSTTPKTRRIRIRTRLVALFLAINVIPLLAILGDAHKLHPMAPDALDTLKALQSSIYAQVFVFMSVGIWVIFLVSSNLSRPFEEIIHVLRDIKNGHFNSRVRVTTNDEIGYTGDAINEMTEGLLERDRIRQSLTLAKQIQQNLFPRGTPNIDGLDLAGRSVYCDETGGDYYDFIPMGTPESMKMGVVVGDVSGHGISSALLMATVRSSLRQRISQPGSASRIISDVNRQLAWDVAYSGDFMTLFFLIADMKAGSLQWVRAGHDAAIVYDPEGGDFRLLEGAGVALGVDAASSYKAHQLTGITGGLVVLLGTDGIWEARNREGEQIGKAPIYEVIRKMAGRSAGEILDAVFRTLETFREGARREDDITAVVVKIDNLN